MGETSTDVIAYIGKDISAQRDTAKLEMQKAGVTFYDLPFAEQQKWADIWSGDYGTNDTTQTTDNGTTDTGTTDTTTTDTTTTDTGDVP